MSTAFENRWVKGQVKAIKAWGPSLYSLFVDAPVDAYLPGQFTQIGLGDEQQLVHRPYSYASVPDEPHLEFYFNHVDNGVLTPALIQLKENDSIWVQRRPAGRFTIQSLAPAKQLCCFATGTGFGVFLSLLKNPMAWTQFEQILLVHSVSDPSFLSHQALIDSFKTQYGDRFIFKRCVTRIPFENAYQARMTTLLTEGILEDDCQLTINAESSQVMLCGNPHMVNEMRALFESRGMILRHPVKGGQITIESYWKA